MTAILAMAGLGIEITFLLYKHRQFQAAADAAALGGAIAKAKGAPADYAMQARALAASVGIVNGVGGVNVTVNSPPTSGSYAGNSGVVEIVISQPQILSLVGLVHAGLFTVGARAAAIIGDEALYCILGLHPTAAGTVRIQNNGAVSSSICGVGVNSGNSSALILENNADIYGPVSVVGNYSLGNGAHLWYQTPPFPKTHAAALPDPYSGVVLSASGAPSRSQPTGCTTCTLLPGRYNSGLNYSNGVTLNLAAGVYYIGSRLVLGNNVTLNATSGVTLVVNGNYGINIGNNVIMNLTGPASGATAGIAFASIRTASASVTHRFRNNATLNLTGALYFPNQTVQFDNNSTINTAVCGQVVARIVSIANNADLKNACTGTGVVPIGSGGGATLVE